MSAVVRVTGMASVYMINSSNATIADVRKWLDEVEKLGIPDTTRLDGTNLKVTLRSDYVERIECGDHVPPEIHQGIVMFDGPCKKDGEMTPEQ